MTTVEEGVNAYINVINQQVQDSDLLHPERSMLKWRKTRKYYKIEREECGSHAFVDADTGDIFKPAGTGPAKGARGNVTDAEYIQYVAAYPRAYFGGHLYAQQSSVRLLSASVTETGVIAC